MSDETVRGEVPEGTPDCDGQNRCDRCGGLLREGGQSVAVYQCEDCGRYFDQRMNPVRVTDMVFP